MSCVPPRIITSRTSLHYIFPPKSHRLQSPSVHVCLLKILPPPLNNCFWPHFHTCLFTTPIPHLSHNTTSFLWTNIHLCKPQPCQPFTRTGNLVWPHPRFPHPQQQGSQRAGRQRLPGTKVRVGPCQNPSTQLGDWSLLGMRRSMGGHPPNPSHQGEGGGWLPPGHERKDQLWVISPKALSWGHMLCGAITWPS